MSQTFKPSIQNAVSKGTNFSEKVWLSMRLLAVLDLQGIVLKKKKRKQPPSFSVGYIEGLVQANANFAIKLYCSAPFRIE